jgi:CRP/FNR family transcriptional regulator
MQRPDPEALRQALRRIPFFGGLDASLIDLLAQAAVWREYTAGAVVFLEGDASSGLYQMDTGWIKVLKLSPDGREQVLRLIGPGEVFNEIGVFAGRPNPATAITLEPTGLWLIEQRAVHHVLETHPPMAIQVMERMADRISELVMLVADLSLHTVEERLARLLLQTPGDVLIRALRSLTDAGLIEVDRQRIRLLDRAGLEAKAMVTIPAGQV